MTTTYQDPISTDWTNTSLKVATAAELSEKLAHFSVAELPPVITPYIAAAAAELAAQADVPWRLSTDPAQIALLRMLAKVAILAPDASGPHTAALVGHLDRLKACG